MSKNDNGRMTYAFFEYNGKYYGPGTVVKFKSTYLPHMQRENELYGKYYAGHYYEKHHGFRLGDNPNNCNGCCGGTSPNGTVYDIIDEIIVPVEVQCIPYKKEWVLKDWEDSELMMWWVIYIAAMLGSCIFVWPLRLFLWAVASFVFWGCRHEKLKQYGYK